MIISAAFVPSAPLLVPDVAQGATSELDDVRAASVRGITDAVEGADRVVVVGAGTTTRVLSTGTGSFRGFGVPLDVDLDPASADPTRLPLSLSVGLWLLAYADISLPRTALELDAAVGDDALEAAGAALRDGDDRVALVVVADGSSSRTEKAPGYLHPDAEAFDADVARALAGGDADVLAALDRARAVDVGSTGYPAWRTAAAALGGTAYDARVLVDAAPYGVGYHVALWRS